MSLQWLKRKANEFEGKKENSKVNDRIQKLICDLKSKRESLAAVQTGFPSSVASFVTNTWMPSVHGGENKKTRWSSMRRKGTFNAKCPSDEVRDSRDLQSGICSEPQIVGQVASNLQSGSELLEKIYTDRQSVGLFSGHHPQSEGEIVKQVSVIAGSSGRFGEDPQFVGQYGDDPQFVGQSGKEAETEGEFGNVPGQVVSDSRSVRQSGNYPHQFGCEIESASQSDSDALSLQLGHKRNREDHIVEEVRSIRDISACVNISERSARFCPFCKELVVASFVLAVSLSVLLDVKTTAVGVTAIVYFLVRVFNKQKETEPKTNYFSAKTCIVTILPSICKGTVNSLRGAADLLICRNLNKFDAGATVPCLNSAKDACEGIQFSKPLNSDVNKEPRHRGTLVNKSCMSRGNSGGRRSLEVGVKGLKFSSALESSVLIVVLMGLLAGRFPAFVLALAWYFVLKLVQIVEQGNNIPSFQKRKRQPKYIR